MPTSARSRAGGVGFGLATRNLGEKVKRRRIIFACDAFRRIASLFRRFLLGPKKAVATIRWYAPGRLVASHLRKTRELAK